MQITLHITASGALTDGRAPEIFDRSLDAAITEATLFLEARVKSRTPRDTGNLAESMQHDFEGKGTPVMKGTVTTKTEYALAVETGTGVHGPKGVPFVIKAKPGKALFWPGLEHPVKQVTIQGMVGAHMFENTLLEDAAKLDGIFAKHGLKIIKELNQ